MSIGLIVPLLGVSMIGSGWQAPQPVPTDRPKSPVVAVVGCASESAEPHIWILARASARSVTDRAGLTAGEKARLASQSLGDDTYQLIGVADFVDAAAAARIGQRGKLMPPSRMNTTGMLASGHKAAVKGLFIAGPPARINLTSVADLGMCR